MSISKTENNRLLLRLAKDGRYKFFKNGTVKKRGTDGVYRTVGTERHGYNVITYGGKKLVTARAILAHYLVSHSVDTTTAVSVLNLQVLVRKNGISLDDRIRNLKATSSIRGFGDGKSRRLTRKQIDRMVELFCEGFSVAKIARRFRRKVSRSYISTIIRRELLGA